MDAAALPWPAGAEEWEPKAGGLGFRALSGLAFCWGVGFQNAEPGRHVCLCVSLFPGT